MASVIVVLVPGDPPVGVVQGLFARWPAAAPVAFLFSVMLLWRGRAAPPVLARAVEAS